MVAGKNGLMHIPRMLKFLHQQIVCISQIKQHYVLVTFQGGGGNKTQANINTKGRDHNKGHVLK